MVMGLIGFVRQGSVNYVLHGWKLLKKRGAARIFIRYDEGRGGRKERREKGREGDAHSTDNHPLDSTTEMKVDSVIYNMLMS